jgi:hypothetical protein
MFMRPSGRLLVCLILGAVPEVAAAGRLVPMTRRRVRVSAWVLVALCAVSVAVALAQNRQAPGKPIGAISTRGDLIVLTLDEGALGKANLFDLVKHTLRFTPDGGGYRVENVPFAWDAEFGGQAPPRTPVTLREFAFPFSGRKWDSLNLDTPGSIAFGGVVTIGRFDQLRNAAGALVNKTPAIAVFLKPRMSGARYVKELPDRLVVTWTLTEPAGGIQDFTWTPTVNRFQAVLSKDGAIQMSYDELAAKDAIVGVYPSVPAGTPPAGVAAVDLSSVKKSEGPFAAVYESFHYLSLPNHRDLTCTVLKALGDKFDFLAYYSDFRVDNQEAGTPSNGPLGGGPNGGEVTGIGAAQRGLDSYCTAGRFQWQFIQPVYVGSNQMQERPPPGITDANNHNIGFYMRQLGERTPDGRIPAYDYALSQIGHEMGHRWSAFVSARVNGETIRLGPTHWARGLHAPAPFPFQRPSEASAMGGGVWQDNVDGTFTQLDDDYYVPATGFSYLDLYLMGLITPSEVPDFFMLGNLTPAGRDANGHPIFRADRTKIAIQDVIAVEGARQPDVDHAQKRFNTGMVVIVEHGRKPSRELIERTQGIRAAWIDYFATVTGHRAAMTATPR